MVSFDFTIPPINLYNMGKTKYYSFCPHCGKRKDYASKDGLNKCKDKPCRSCSNSIKLGGKHWEGKCIDCGGEKDCEYSSSLCKSCHKKRSSTYHMQNYRFRKYGVTREWYEEEVKRGCAICAKPLSSETNVKRDRGHIDHCHKTGKVRGILCDLCNKGLGQFQDNTDLLKKAIEYLERDKNG